MINDEIGIDDINTGNLLINDSDIPSVQTDMLDEEQLKSLENTCKS